MAEVRLIEPVVKICAVITRFDQARDWAIRRIESRWGKIAGQSLPMPFEAGGYYQKEMGGELKKTLIEVESFADPAGLADWKHETNDWEREYARSHALPPAPLAITRPLNLDAGYLTQAKLVLATTKDRDHRIYLRDGMFAEVTLNYRGKQWVHHRWSYPSYRRDEVSEFAMSSRQRLRSYLISTGQLRRAHTVNASGTDDQTP